MRTEERREQNKGGDDKEEELYVTVQLEFNFILTKQNIVNSTYFKGIVIELKACELQ